MTLTALHFEIPTTMLYWNIDFFLITAVKRDPNDQTIVEEGQTGTDTQEAEEEYKRKGMTKVSDDE